MDVLISSLGKSLRFSKLSGCVKLLYPKNPTTIPSEAVFVGTKNARNTSFVGEKTEGGHLATLCENSDVRPLVFGRLTRSVHDLKGGAATQLLLYIGNDTHTDILVYPEVYGHEGPLSF